MSNMWIIYNLNPFKKRIEEVDTDEAIKLINISEAKSLLYYFQDLEYAETRTYKGEDGDQFMGKVAIDFWFCDSRTGSLEGNIGSLGKSRVKPWSYLKTKFGDKTGYRVWIELNKRYKSLPDNIFEDIKSKINTIESNENFNFFSLQIRNYNWDKYKTSHLFTKNLEWFKKYDGDIVSFGLIFTLNN